METFSSKYNDFYKDEFSDPENEADRSKTTLSFVEKDVQAPKEQVGFLIDKSERG